MNSANIQDGNDSHLMELSKCLAELSAPSLCVCFGGSQNDFTRAIVLSEKRPIRILANRSVASDVARAANEELVPVPSVIMSRGLRTDLQSLLTGADGPATVLPHEIVHDFVRARAKRLAQDMGIVAGYPPPSDLVIECVVKDLRALLLQVSKGGRSPVIVHDLLGIVLPTDAPGMIFFADPAHPPVAAKDAQTIGAEERLEYGDDDDVAIDLIREHAEFVADSKPDDLRRMCPILAEPTAAPLREFWRRSFTRLEDDEYSGWLLERANRLLNDAFETK